MKLSRRYSADHRYSTRFVWPEPSCQDAGEDAEGRGVTASGVATS